MRTAYPEVVVMEILLGVRVCRGPVVHVKEVAVAVPITHGTVSIVTAVTPLNRVPVNVSTVPPSIVPVVGLTAVTVGVIVCIYWKVPPATGVVTPLSNTSTLQVSELEESI